MYAARLAVGASALAAACFHAWLLAATGLSPLPPLLGAAAGFAVRAAGGSVTAVCAALAVAPIWSVVGASLWPGAPPFEPLWPWIAFLTAALAWPTPAGWHTTGWWRLALAAWSLAVAVTWPLVAARELDFTLATIDAVTVNGPSVGSPTATASFAVLMSIAQIAAILLADWFVGCSESARRRMWWSIVPGTIALGGAAIWQQLVDPAFLSGEPWIGLRRAAGTLLDANASGALLAVLGPALALQLRASSTVSTGLTTGLAATLLVLTVAGVEATGSRTALAAVIGTFVALVVARNRLAGGALLAGLLIATVLLARQPQRDLTDGAAAGRLASTVSRVLQGGPAGVWSLVWDREGYGSTARAIIADYPWFGIGVGTFPAMLGSYGRRPWDGTPFPADNAQNWWRHGAAELGLFGNLPAFTASVLLALTALRQLGRRQAAAAAPVVALGLMALLSSPTAHPIPQVFIGLIAAASIAAAGAARPQPASRATEWGVWLFAAACAAGTAVTGVRDLRPPYRAADFHFAYNYGTTDIVSTPFGEGRWMGTRAVAVIPPTQSRTLVTQVVAPHDDLAAHPVAIWISDRHRVICRGRVSDHTPLVCRVPVPVDAWPMLQVEVERPWREVDGVPRAAVVSARFE